MIGYQRYMDRQQVSETLHQRLLKLEPPKKQIHWTRWGALAACCALLVGVGVWRLMPGPALVQSGNQFAAGYEPEPGEKDTYGPGELPEDASPMQPPERDFVVSGPEDAGKQPFPVVPEINYQDVSNSLEADASRAFAPGSFILNLEKEGIQTVFWGPEGKPEAVHPKMEQGDLPWALFWDGYTVYGYAWYDSQGQLTELTVYGDQGRASFILELRLGALPFSCTADPDRETSEVQGVEITGWSRAYDRDGDGLTDYICGSEFMLGDVGIRFENRNSSLLAEYGGAGNMELGGAEAFNALFVAQALRSPPYLDHLMTAEVPAWREETFSTLAQARQEADFAPYLPQTEPAGFHEFYGRLSYQEGTQNTLWVRWSRGYDDVEVRVERDGYYSYNLADPANPASYDVRSYDVPWAESVPKEYLETVNCPAFLAQDMSLDIVTARGHEKDTGGLDFRFDVVHPDGTVVCYHCGGMTAEQVWALVEETLP